MSEQKNGIVGLNFCEDCPNSFIITEKDAARYAENGWVLPKRCSKCRDHRREQGIKAGTSIRVVGAE
jgi:hypothetical protein